MMEVRRAGEIPTFDTRSEANDKVDREKRYKQILEVMRYCKSLFGECALTAKQIAEYMRLKGEIPTNERNFVSPRLTELMAKGIVEPAGKVKCRWTGRTVTAYRIREEANNGRIGGIQH